MTNDVRIFYETNRQKLYQILFKWTFNHEFVVIYFHNVTKSVVIILTGTNTAFM